MIGDKDSDIQATSKAGVVLICRPKNMLSFQRQISHHNTEYPSKVKKMTIKAQVPSQISIFLMTYNLESCICQAFDTFLGQVNFMSNRIYIAAVVTRSAKGLLSHIVGYLSSVLLEIARTLILPKRKRFLVRVLHRDAV